MARIHAKQQENTRDFRVNRRTNDCHFRAETTRSRPFVANLRRILAVELVCAGAALDHRAPLRPGPGTGAALAMLRTVVAPPGPDRWLSPDLRAAEALLAEPAFLAAIAAAIGPFDQDLIDQDRIDQDQVDHDQGGST